MWAPLPGPSEVGGPQKEGGAGKKGRSKRGRKKQYI